MNFYPWIVALSLAFAAKELWDIDLLVYPILAGIGVLLMLTLRYYPQIWVIERAVGTQNQLLRYFLLRSSIFVSAVAPLLLTVTAYLFDLDFFLVRRLRRFVRGLGRRDRHAGIFAAGCLLPEILGL